MKRQITIAGGGIAGLALGIALRRRDVPVRVIEAGNYPRHRVCGEFVSGITTAELDALGLRPLFDRAPRHTTTAWFDRGRELLRRELPGHAYGVSRFALDSELAGNFTALGGELRCGERVPDGGEGVVWTTGRPRGRPEWLGLKAHFDDLRLRADLEVHLSDTGYVGLTRIEDGRVNVSGLFHRSQAAGGGAALVATIAEAGLPELAGRVGAASQVAGSLKGVTHFSLGWQRQDPRRVCVGDSSAMIPPFTGNGMTMAFQSALAAAPRIAGWSTEGGSWPDVADAVRKDLAVLFSRRLRWARIIQSLLLHRAGRRLALAALASGLVRFETLYAKVR